VYVEDCRFKNLTHGGDRGCILMMGVNNYIGRRNSISYTNLINPVYNLRSSAIHLAGTSGREYYSYIAFADSDEHQSGLTTTRSSVRAVMDSYTYSGYGPEMNVYFIGCTFANNSTTSHGALYISYQPNDAFGGGPIIVGQSDVVNVYVQKCKFINDVNGITLEGNGAAVLAGVRLNIQNNEFKQVTNPIVEEASYTSNYRALFIERNEFLMCGDILTGIANPEKYNTGNAQETSILLREKHHSFTAITDGYYAGIDLKPIYNGTGVITRHNYVNISNNSGDAPLTNAAIMRFDANIPAGAVRGIGEHTALYQATTKTTPGTVNGWMQVNVNGAIFYSPLYASPTT
jgi:hypothetical protein